MKVKLVPAKAADASAISGLVRELAREIHDESPVTPRVVREYLSRGGGRIILARVGAEAVGLISYSNRPGLYHAASSCLIEELVVRKDFRRMGIADKLVAEVIARAKKARCAEVSVSTGKRNRGAISLYRKHGMIEESLLLEKHF